MIQPRDGSALRAEVQWDFARHGSTSGPPKPMRLRLDSQALPERIGDTQLDGFDLAVWLHSSISETAGSGEGARGAGGRFNPPNSFPVVYGALRRVTAGAELRRLAQRNGIELEHLLPRHISRLRLKATEVLDLRRDDVREFIGLPAGLLSEDSPYETQLIGQIAHALGIEAVVAPSVTGIGDIIAVFPDILPGIADDIRPVELWLRPDHVPDSDPGPRTA
jgi:RES domain-containing protein